MTSEILRRLHVFRAAIVLQSEKSVLGIVGRRVLDGEHGVRSAPCSRDRNNSRRSLPVRPHIEPDSPRENIGVGQGPVVEPMRIAFAVSHTQCARSSSRSVSERPRTTVHNPSASSGMRLPHAAWRSAICLSATLSSMPGAWPDSHAILGAISMQELSDPRRRS